MNMRQSLKAASERIGKLEDWNNKSKKDIKAYNECIDGVIQGRCSFCDWCEENRLGECDKPEKGTGCAEWWLLDVSAAKIPEEGGQADGGQEDLSETILSAGPEG